MQRERRVRQEFAIKHSRASQPEFEIVGSFDRMNLNIETRRRWSLFMVGSTKFWLPHHFSADCIDFQNIFHWKISKPVLSHESSSHGLKQAERLSADLLAPSLATALPPPYPAINYNPRQPPILSEDPRTQDDWCYMTLYATWCRLDTHLFILCSNPCPYHLFSR